MTTPDTRISFVNTMCMEGWRLRLVYLGSDDRFRRVFSRRELVEHVCGCPDCQAYYAELTDAAAKLEYTEEMK